MWGRIKKFFTKKEDRPSYLKITREAQWREAELRQSLESLSRDVRAMSVLKSNTYRPKEPAFVYLEVPNLLARWIAGAPDEINRFFINQFQQMLGQEFAIQLARA
jgi:hypothetical protein